MQTTETVENLASMLAAVESAPMDIDARRILADAYMDAQQDGMAEHQRKIVAGLEKVKDWRGATIGKGHAIYRTLTDRLKYRKKEGRVHVALSVSITGTWWDGGSRSSFYALDLTTGALSPIAGPQWGDAKPSIEHPIRKGIAIVECGTFCGKPATARITLHPDDAWRI
jgi:hypothetical protein